MVRMQYEQMEAPRERVCTSHLSRTGVLALGDAGGVMRANLANFKLLLLFDIWPCPEGDFRYGPGLTSHSWSLVEAWPFSRTRSFRGHARLICLFTLCPIF